MDSRVTSNTWYYFVEGQPMSLGASPNLSGGLSMEPSGPHCNGGGGNGGGNGNGGGGSCPVGGGLPGFGGGVGGGGGIGVWDRPLGGGAGAGAGGLGFLTSGIGSVGILDGFLALGPGGSLKIPGGFAPRLAAGPGIGGSSGSSVLAPDWAQGWGACAPPPGLPEPPPAPGPGSPFQQVAVAYYSGSTVGGINVTCLDTGVTITSSCSGTPPFYHTTGGLMHPKTYIATGGSGTQCSTGQDHTYKSLGPASQPPPTGVQVPVQPIP